MKGACMKKTENVIIAEENDLVFVHIKYFKLT